MGSEKRERQKANRAARLEEEAKIAKRQRAFRAARTIGIAAAAVFGAAILISFLSGSSGDETTTTTTADSTTTTSGATTTTSPDAAPAPTDYELFAGQATACGSTQPPAPAELSYEAAEDQAIDPSAAVTAVVTTSCGDITLELDPTAAPETVNSFVFLAREGYFDGTAMHRISPGFVIQGGDPTATGTGSPGYTLPDELPAAGTAYEEGVLAMANSGPNSGGSQFFITVADTTLQPDFTIFGRVTGGQEAIDAITAVPLGANARGELSRPLESVYIESVTITVG